MSVHEDPELLPEVEDGPEFFPEADEVSLWPCFNPTLPRKWITGTELVERISARCRDAKGRVPPWEVDGEIKKFKSYLVERETSPGGILDRFCKYTPMEPMEFLNPSVWSHCLVGWISTDPNRGSAYLFHREIFDSWFDQSLSDESRALSAQARDSTEQLKLRRESEGTLDDAPRDEAAIIRLLTTYFRPFYQRFSGGRLTVEVICEVLATHVGVPKRILRCVATQLRPPEHQAGGAPSRQDADSITRWKSETKLSRNGQLTLSKIVEIVRARESNPAR